MTETNESQKTDEKQTKQEGDPMAKKLADVEAEAALLKDQLQRTLADFANFRRQTEKRVQDLKAFVLRDVFVQVLPIVDNLEAALNSIKQTTDVQTVVAGVKLVHEFAVKVLADNKLEPIRSVGEIFDPACHEAIATVPAPGVDASRIVFEAQKGYKLGDVVIRYAKVGVAAPADDAPAAEK